MVLFQVEENEGDVKEQQGRIEEIDQNKEIKKTGVGQAKSCRHRYREQKYGYQGGRGGELGDWD